MGYAWFCGFGIVKLKMFFVIKEYLKTTLLCYLAYSQCAVTASNQAPRTNPTTQVTFVPVNFKIRSHLHSVTKRIAIPAETSTEFYLSQNSPRITSFISNSSKSTTEPSRFYASTYSLTNSISATTTTVNPSSKPVSSNPQPKATAQPTTKPTGSPSSSCKPTLTQKPSSKPTLHPSTIEPSLSNYIKYVEESVLCDIIHAIQIYANMKCNSSLPRGHKLSIKACDDTNIVCDNLTGRITALSLAGHGIVYPPWVLPPSIGNLTSLTYLYFDEMNLVGPIPESIGNLVNLQQLQITGNALTGCIPVTITNLRNLRKLILNRNNLNGVIPSTLGTMNRLEILDLSFNSFSGQLPSSIGNMSQLTALYFNANHLLTGFIPPEICNMSQLQVLKLSGNSFHCQIPACIGNLLSLQILDMGWNSLSGSVPPSIGNLKRLQSLTLNSNSLIGHIPESIGDLWQLSLLDLNTNRLSGPIPESIGKLLNLTSLTLYYNILSGPLPDSIGNLSKLTYLSVYGNRFAGHLPWAIGNMDRIVSMDLFGNAFSGELPASICYLQKLEHINLSGMRISGPLPSSIGNMTSLSIIDIRGNQLTGSIPNSIGKLKNLVQLSLQDNQLSGPIPNSIGHLTRLSSLDLNGNKLTGVIPGSIGGLINLAGMSLFGNQLRGHIPSAIGNLMQLTKLDLYSNKLSGSIPNSIGKLLLLQDLSLQVNGLIGAIPESVGNLVSLQTLRLYENQLTGKIPTLSILTNLTTLLLYSNQLTGPIFYMIGELSALTYLELHSNELSGHIPPSITFLSSLQTLKLNLNKLKGHIPPNIGDMTNLKDLELQSNRLSGRIPATICNLVNIPNLYLYSNQLTGPIPADIGNLGQLQSLQLYSNKLTGNIPYSMGSLPNLVNLDLNSNNLNSNIPNSMSKLGNLQSLDLSYNMFNDSIPNFFGTLRSLKSLLLQSNQFTGRIPSSWGALSNLKFLSVSSNQLRGPIPSSFSQLGQLQTLDVSSNYLLGTLSKIGFSDSLIALNLSQNNFSGVIPTSFGSLKNLASLNLNDNTFSGQVPSSLCNLSVLAELTLSNNSFTCYPTCFAVSSQDLLSSYEHCPVDLDKALCDFSAALNMSLAISKVVLSTSLTIESSHPLPVNFASFVHEVHVEGAFDFLVSVDSRTFSFLTDYAGIGGGVQPPISFCSTRIWDNSSCYSIDIVSHSYELPGILSVAPFKVPWRTRFFVIIIDNNNYYSSAAWGYRLTIAIQSHGVGWVCTNESYATDFCFWTGVTCDNSAFPTGLSLGGLNLKGKIHPAIGGLNGLTSLDLSSNRFSGELPASMKSMTKLVTVDLSSNYLSGPIPQFMTSLSKLTTFSVSSNSFNGTMPIFLSKFLVSLNLNYNRFYGKISSDSCNMLINGTGLVIKMRGNYLTCYETCWDQYASSRNVFDADITGCMPSSQPSSSPSSQPSIMPSNSPSSPSSQPSLQPSAIPSSTPTNPTSQPSDQPINVPTYQPSEQPYFSPSLQPSTQPSSIPTNPSAQPSNHPSNCPSSKPTQPSSHPSRQPSRLPSCQPTVNPTKATQSPVVSSSTASSGVTTTTVFIIVGVIVVLVLVAVVVALRISAAYIQKMLYKGLPIHEAIIERRKIGEKIIEGELSTAYLLDRDNRTALDLWLERNAKSAIVDEFTLDLLYRIVAGDLPTQEGMENTPDVVPFHNTLPSRSNPYLDFFPVLRTFLGGKKSRYAAVDVEQNINQRKRCTKGYCWTTIIQRNEDFAAQIVSRIMITHKAICDQLCFTLDSYGRKHLDIASIKCKLILNKNRFLHERYDLKQGPPEHKSNTSLIRFATDQKSGNNQPDGSQGSVAGTVVAMKFMRNRDQFLSEINSRSVADFSNEYVISLLRSYDGDSQEQGDLLFRQDAIVKGYTDYPYCAVLSVADQNLKKVIDQQNICGKDWTEIQQITRQLATCIDHMHSKGYIHGDLKPTNIVLTGQRLQLIDLDASASFTPSNRQYAGAKFSSAYFPPEMLIKRPDGSLNIRVNSDRADRTRTKDIDEESTVVKFDLLPACPSYDMWSLGAILYLLSTGCILLRATVDDTALMSELQVLYDWTDSTTYERVHQITDKNARNLVSLLLRKDPLKRLSAKYVLSHPFLTGMKPVRLQGEKAYFDVFLSYRVDSDSDHVSYLYQALTARGLKVWWDKELLIPGQPWEDGFCAGLVNAATFVCLLSRGAINHPQKRNQNFSQLSNTSKCDNLLLEWSLALELRERGMMHGIFPIFIGDKGFNGTYGDYFGGECHPFPIPNTTVATVSTKLQEHLDKQSLGAAYFEQTTVKQVVDNITAQQGGFIRGDGGAAFDAVVDRIVQMRRVA